MVLLDSDLVAIDAGCCCGECTTCLDFIAAGSPCTDMDGNCHPIENCDGTCSGPITPCVNIRWMTETQYCVDAPECTTSSLNCVSSVDPVTCEFTQIGPCGDCPEGQTVITSESVRWIPCSTCVGEECGACCGGGVEDICYTMSETECDDFFGGGFTFYAGLSCDGFFCPV